MVMDHRRFTVRVLIAWSSQAIDSTALDSILESSWKTVALFASHHCVRARWLI